MLSIQPQHYHRSRTSPLCTIVTAQEIHATLTQHPANKLTHFLVYLSITELVQAQHTAVIEAELVQQLVALLRHNLKAYYVGYEGAGRLIFLLSSSAEPQPTLYRFARRMASSTFISSSGKHRLTPAIGYVARTNVGDTNAQLTHAQTALAQAIHYNDLQPICYQPTKQTQQGFQRLAAMISGLGLHSNAIVQVIASFVLSFVLPFLLFMGMDRFGYDITPLIYLGTVAILLITSYLVWYEGLLAVRQPAIPAEPQEAYPPASAIIAAYLPNEAPTIVETIKAFLGKVHYPGPFELILAYNTPHDLPVERELHALATVDPRLRLLRVAESTSKAQNVNAALALVNGTFVGIFDADHHPAADSFARAWRWLANGYDIVQGHCVIRNGGDSWVTQLVSVEFEAIYAVAHPGRARMHGFGIFGGSNGYWRTEVLRDIRLRAAMLTEDIDASLRALIAGHNIASDPMLLSHELAPLTLQALWNQRMRWAQGWLQVSIKHTWAALCSPMLSLRQKLGIFHLLVWRELYPWLSIQIVTVLAFWIWHDGITTINLLVPIFVLTTLLTFSNGPGQVLFAYLLGSPTIRRRWHWYLLYLVSALLYYTGLKNLISRVSLIKELLHEKQWKVTPRQQLNQETQLGAIQ